MDDGRTLGLFGTDRAGTGRPIDGQTSLVRVRRRSSQGLPAAGDRGLDNSRIHERIYWGGNLYWLVADLRIREKTNNRHSVDDAIRAILDAGGDGAATWSLDRVLSVGDQATQTTVLKDLHDELGPRPGAVNLDALWRQLGVQYRSGVITFDDSAPLAGIRTAITSGREPGK